MYVARSIEMTFRVRDLKVPNKAHGSPGDGTLGRGVSLLHSNLYLIPEEDQLYLVIIF